MRSDWTHADRETGEARDEERREAGEEGGRQRGHDLERQRLRVEGDERRDEHAEPPATTHASTVFAIARRLGERPASMAEASFSDAALVDSPKGVQR